jgi:hypothetical protein
MALKSNEYFLLSYFKKEGNQWMPFDLYVNEHPLDWYKRNPTSTMVHWQPVTKEEYDKGQKIVRGRSKQARWAFTKDEMVSSLKAMLREMEGKGIKDTTIKVYESAIWSFLCGQHINNYVVGDHNDEDFQKYS